MKPFRQIQANQYILQQIQDAIAQALNPVLALPIVDGRLIENVALGTGGVNLVTHGLGRPPKLWMLARVNADCRIWETTARTTDLQLALNTSAPVMVSLWVA